MRLDPKLILSIFFILSLLLIALDLLVIVDSSDDVVDLYTKTKRKIPDTLPWYSIIVFGDNRPQDTSSNVFPSVFYTFIDELKNINPIAVIGTGDHVGSGYESQYQALYQVFNGSGLENIWLAMGNHDVEVNEGWNNWEKYVGPRYYYVDDIPGWRIGFGNTEFKTTIEFQNHISSFYENLDNRSLILVLHRPVYPDVDHNIRSDWIPVLKSIFDEKGYPKLVLQGHWHGWAYEIRDNVTWIITGGAGAPLYTYGVEEPSKGEVVTGVYHYMVLILYPNQTFTFYPVRIGFGSLNVEQINSTTYMVVNNKLDVHNKPVSMPVRIKYQYEDIEIDFVGMIPGKSIVYVNFRIEEDILSIRANTSNWYIYIYNESNPDQSTVYIPKNNKVTIE
ncbi:MAG: hypothetical protein B6U89_01120, partial [Desulfurococcales archaeon ex4484_58]